MAKQISKEEFSMDDRVEHASFPLDRRTCLAVLLAGLMLPQAGSLMAGVAGGKQFFLGAIGPKITSYRVDAQALTLTEVGTFSVAAPVQYSWQHPSLPLIYVVYSRKVGDKFFDKGMTVLHITPDGILTQAFSPTPLEHRPIHVCVEPNGRYLAVAYNLPSSLTIHPIQPDGQVGPALAQAAQLDTGIFAHQVRFTRDGRYLLMITRGVNGTAQQSEKPGAIEVFGFDRGQLTQLQSIAPNAGLGFGPRHVDLHPTKPWVYALIERQNQLMMFPVSNGRLAGKPSFTKPTVMGSTLHHPRQLAGTIHISADGRFVYVSNRTDGLQQIDGKDVSIDGEDNIAVFRIDQRTGEPTHIQSIPTRSVHPRTFGIDRTGKMLVSATILPKPVNENGRIVAQPAALTVFRIRPDGRLEFARKYDVDTGEETMFWSGMVVS